MRSGELGMKLTKVKLGDLLQLETEKNTGEAYGLDSVKGISTKKTFIETVANMSSVSLKPYILVKPGNFVYIQDTSRRGEKIALAYNSTPQTYIVSSAYTVFSVKDLKLLCPEYLYMFFNRDEFDRYSRFNSWGSARETFSWETMCESEIELPPLAIQQKYVNVYKSLLANQKAYEQGLEDLKLVCDAFIEKLGKEITPQPIGKYLIECDRRNTSGLTSEMVRGIATSKEIIQTKANLEGIDVGNYKLLPPKHIAYVQDTSRRGEKISLGYNSTDSTYLVSAITTVFTTQLDHLLPEYIMLFFCRSEFDRYTRFHSWGSARETFSWSEMCNVRIPIPPLSVQQSIVNIYKVLQTRRKINEQLKEQVKSICPILIKGSLGETERL